MCSPQYFCNFLAGRLQYLLFLATKKWPIKSEINKNGFKRYSFLFFYIAVVCSELEEVPKADWFLILFFFRQILLA